MSQKLAPSRTANVLLSRCIYGTIGQQLVLCGVEPGTARALTNGQTVVIRRNGPLAEGVMLAALLDYEQQFGGSEARYYVKQFADDLGPCAYARAILRSSNEF